MDPDYADQIEIASDYVAAFLGIGFGLTGIIYLLVGYKMNKLLGSVKNMQLLVHMTLMQVVVPANSQVFLSAIFEMISFDVYDTDSMTQTYYSPDEPNVDEKLAQLGYESAFCLMNMGSCLYILFGQLIILLLQSVLLACLQLMCCQGTQLGKGLNVIKNWL